MLTNDKGQRSTDPCEWFCGSGDIESWARVLVTIREQAKSALATYGPDTALEQWLTRTAGKADLATPGLLIIDDFFAEYGLGGNEEAIRDIIREAEDGQRLTKLLVERGGGEYEDPGSLAENERRASELRSDETKNYLLAFGVLGLGIALAMRGKRGRR